MILVQKSVFFCKLLLFRENPPPLFESTMGMGKHNSDPQWPEAVIVFGLS